MENRGQTTVLLMENRGQTTVLLTSGKLKTVVCPLFCGLATKVYHQTSLFFI